MVISENHSFQVRKGLSNLEHREYIWYCEESFSSYNPCFRIPFRGRQIYEAVSIWSS